MFCPRQTTTPKPNCTLYYNTRTYYTARDVQVPAPALYSTAWSDCVVTLAGRSSAVRLDPCARRLRIVRVPWGSYCRANKKIIFRTRPVRRSTETPPQILFRTIEYIGTRDFGYNVYLLYLDAINFLVAADSSWNFIFTVCQQSLNACSRPIQLTICGGVF